MGVRHNHADLQNINTRKFAFDLKVGTCRNNNIWITKPRLSLPSNWSGLHQSTPIHAPMRIRR